MDRDVHAARYPLVSANAATMTKTNGANMGAPSLLSRPRSA
jgi:hypothetical protein